MRDKKEERKKQANKAKQHSTPKLLHIHYIHIHNKDDIFTSPTPMSGAADSLSIYSNEKSIFNFVRIPML